MGTPTFSDNFSSNFEEQHNCILLCWHNSWTNHRPRSSSWRPQTKPGLIISSPERKLNKMLDDSEYIKLEGIDDKEMSLRLSLLSSRNSRRVSDNSTEENSLQQSINETVERNPCKRIGLHQVGKFFNRFC